MDYEVVERKGIGHPDTIADAIANSFTARYANYCLAEFGGVPRYSADKLVVIGAKSVIRFGYANMITPIRCHLIGKCTHHFKEFSIPVEDLFADAVADVLEISLTEERAALLPVELQIVTNDGIGAEHPFNYYEPHSAADLDTVDGDYAANDSAVVFSHARSTDLEYLVWKVENILTCDESRSRFGVGTDVKVIGERYGADVRLQVAVPFVAVRVDSERKYRDYLSIIRQLITEVSKKYSPSLSIVELLLNTKDRPGYGYLTLAGSSLDKGDQGAVGRGNGASGLISMMRPQSMESHAGKNPFRSAGRLYPHICRSLSECAFKEYGLDLSIGLRSSNGASLSAPVGVVALDRHGQRVDIDLPSTTLHDLIDARRATLDLSNLITDLKGRVAADVSA